MAVKTWSAARRAKFKRTMKAKQATAAKQPIRKTKAMHANNGNHNLGRKARTIMIVDDGGRLVPYRLSNVRAYVRVSDAEKE